MAKPVSFPEIRGTLSKIRYPCFIEAKLDGHFVKAYVNQPISKGGTQLYSKGGHIINCPEIIKNLEKAMSRETVLLGELIYGTGKKTEFDEIQKKSNANTLSLAIHDIETIENEQIKELPLIDRKELLISLIENNNLTNLAIIKSFICENKEDIDYYYKLFIENGLEGAVVKNLDSKLINGPCEWVKMKEKDQNVCKVIFIDPLLERIEVEHEIPNKKPLIVGVKCSEDDKKTLTINDKVIIEHQGITKSSLRHPVYKGKETECPTTQK